MCGNARRFLLAWGSRIFSVLAVVEGLFGFSVYGLLWQASPAPETGIGKRSQPAPILGGIFRCHPPSNLDQVSRDWRECICAWWENPELPEGSWARDEADCRLKASERAAGELGTFEQGWSDGPDRAQSVVESWKWQQTRGQERELLEACMIKKGYLWASTDANADESAKDVEDQ